MWHSLTEPLFSENSVILGELSGGVNFEVFKKDTFSRVEAYISTNGSSMCRIVVVYNITFPKLWNRMKLTEEWHEVMGSAAHRRNIGLSELLRTFLRSLQ